ncbi:MAG: hypothetical protein GXP55_12415 [Deltaproteobacteria bacterium]|nr:hypothetical protein [Deltaproteobacteria bacterium]
MGTQEALEVIDAVRLHHNAALSMLIGPISDHGLVRACAQRLALYSPSPADSMTLAALASNAAARLRAEAIDAQRTVVAARAAELDLTRRQADVLDLLAQGMAGRQVCAQLDVTRSTYRKHVATILMRTGYRRTADLLASWDLEM